ncbi:MAG: trypsin-like peptidase domain-containing protein [Candidatus Methanomethylophilaceae archaeon]|nr:trypsin-like peptidase domain-containing protein [Candidatus Methanomethylophilaceae archaeon]
MFAEACRTAKGFTRPVATSIRYQDGTVTTALNSFIIVNRDGWALTAGHTFDTLVKHENDRKKMEEISRMSAPGQPGAPSSPVKMDPKFILNHSFWWGWDGVLISEVTVDRKIDIALVKLVNFKPEMVSNYPVFASPDSISLGKSVCRLGHPFVDPPTEFDPVHNAFRIPKIDSDAAMFVNDGVVSKIVTIKKAGNSLIDAVYMDTSTPGYRGQAGGPIVDVKGRVCGMQINTLALPFGFHSASPEGERNPVEDQYCCVGRGVHVKTIREFLDSKNIRYGFEDSDEEYTILERGGRPMR